MATIQDSLITDLILNGVSEYQSGMNQSASATQKLEQNQRALFAAAVALKVPLAAVGTTLLSATKSMVGMADEFQQLEIGFKTLFTNMGRGATASKEFVRELKDFAAVTPFTYRETGKLSKQLMAYKIEARNTIPLMKTLGDATTALGGGEDSLNRLVRAMGQINAKGKMTGEEVRQLSEVGIPAMQILSEKLGLTASEVGAVGRAGISSDKAIAALTEGMNEAFGGGMQARMETFSGQASNLKDNFDYLTASLGDELLPTLISVTKSFGNLVRFIDSMPDGVKSVLAWSIALGGAAASLKFIIAGIQLYNNVQNISIGLAAKLATEKAKEAAVTAANTNAINAETTALRANNQARSVFIQTGTLLGQPIGYDLDLTAPAPAPITNYSSPYPRQDGPMQGPPNFGNGGVNMRGGFERGGASPWSRQGTSAMWSPGTIRGAQAARSALGNAGKSVLGAVGAVGGPAGLALMAVVGGIAWGAKAIADRKNMVAEFSQAMEEGVFKEHPASKAVIRDFEKNKEKIAKAAGETITNSIQVSLMGMELKGKTKRSEIAARQGMNPAKTEEEAAKYSTERLANELEIAKTEQAQAAENLRTKFHAFVGETANPMGSTLENIYNSAKKYDEWQAAVKDKKQSDERLVMAQAAYDQEQDRYNKLQDEKAAADAKWAAENGKSYDSYKTKAINVTKEITDAEMAATKADINKDPNSKYDALMKQSEAGYTLAESLREQAKYTKDAEEKSGLLEDAMKAEIEAMKDKADASDLLTEKQEEQRKAQEKLLDQQKELSQQRIAEQKGKGNLIDAIFGEKSMQADAAKSSLRKLLEAEAANALSMGDTVRYYDLATEATNLYRNSVDSLYGSLKRATEVGNAYTDYLKTIGMEKESDKYTRNVLSQQYAGLAQDAFARGDQSAGYQLAAQAETAARAGGRNKKGQLTNALGGLGTGAPVIVTNNQEFANKFGGLMNPYAGREETINNQLKQNQTILNITNIFNAGTEYQKAESIRIQSDTNEANYYNNFTF